MCQTDPVDDRTGRVVRPVVDDDDLVAIGGVVEQQQRLEEPFDHELFVATGDQHAHERSVPEVEPTTRAHVARRRRQRRRGEREVPEEEDDEDDEQADDDDETRVLHVEGAVQDRREPREQQQGPRGARRTRVLVGSAHRTLSVRVLGRVGARQNTTPPTTTVNTATVARLDQPAAAIGTGFVSHAVPGAVTR